MEAQANTTREQSNKNNIYDVGWRPSHGENGGVGKKKIPLSNRSLAFAQLILESDVRRATHWSIGLTGREFESSKIADKICENSKVVSQAPSLFTNILYICKINLNVS